MSGVVHIKSGSEEDLLAAVATVGPTAVVVDGRSNGFRVHCERIPYITLSIGFFSGNNKTLSSSIRPRTRPKDGLHTV